MTIEGTPLPIRPCELVRQAEAHPGHRWTQMIAATAVQVRWIVWCPGVDELVVSLPRLDESGTLEPIEGDDVSIVDEGSSPHWEDGRTYSVNPDPLPVPTRATLEGRPERQARLAYYAWGNMRNGVDFRGVQLPDWGQMPQLSQQAWIEAARAVRADTLNPDHVRQIDDARIAPWLRVERGHGPAPKPRGGESSGN